MISANASATRSSRSPSACWIRSDGLEGADHGVRLVAAERAPEAAVAAGGAQGVDELGVEPGAAAVGGDVEHGARAGGGEEHLDRLGEADDAAEQRDRVAGQAVGVAVAVPVLVERLDRLGGRLRELDHAGDVGAALAAQLGHLAGALGAAAGDRGEPAGARVADRVLQGLERAQVVGQLAGALELEVVGPEQGGQLGGVARAAGVLEQQRVEQRRAGGVVEPDLLADAHADRARAHGVAHRLALGDVEGVRERRDDL